MGIREKIKNAKKNTWIVEGISEPEVKTLVELAQISAKIQRRRIEMGMSQKEFAGYLGVTQGMVSKWEKNDYNFTIRSLNEICSKIGLEFTPLVGRKYERQNYSLISTKRKKTYQIKKEDIKWMAERGAIA